MSSPHFLKYFLTHMMNDDYLQLTLYPLILLCLNGNIVSQHGLILKRVHPGSYRITWYVTSGPITLVCYTRFLAIFIHPVGISSMAIRLL